MEAYTRVYGDRFVWTPSPILITMCIFLEFRRVNLEGVPLPHRLLSNNYTLAGAEKSSTRLRYLAPSSIHLLTQFLSQIASIILFRL